LSCSIPDERRYAHGHYPARASRASDGGVPLVLLDGGYAMFPQNMRKKFAAMHSPQIEGVKKISGRPPSAPQS